MRDKPQGLTRTEIRNLFSRNVTGERIDCAREALKKAHLIRVEIDRTDGRPAERWIIVDVNLDDPV